MEKYGDSSNHYMARRSLDNIIFNKSFADAVFMAEMQFNEYAEKKGEDLDIHSDHVAASLSINLDSLLNTYNEVEKHCTVIGNGYIGNLDFILPDESGLDQPEDNCQLAMYRNLDFYGFEFTQIPGETVYRAMLKFTESREALNSLGYYDEEEIPTFYFRPDEVLSLQIGENLNNELLVMSLRSKAAKNREILENIHLMPSLEQHELLRTLSYESAFDVMAMLGDEEIHADADLFYEVVSTDDKKLSIKKIENSKGKSYMRYSPMGVVTGCAFIETVLDVHQRELPLGELIETEPCIVLSDDELRPQYLVPISRLNDVITL